MVRTLLSILGRQIYGGIFPCSTLKGAETYFVDCAKDISMKVAWIHFSVALIFYFSPWLSGFSWLPFPYLSEKKKELHVRRLFLSRFYFFNLLVQAVRSHAIVAIFRDPEARLHGLDSKRFQSPPSIDVRFTP